MSDDLEEFNKVYGARDKEFLDKGLDKILNFILIYVKKNS